MSGTGRGGDDGRVADRLSALGDGGSVVLATGGSRAAHGTLASRLQDVDASAPRRRVLVTTDGTFGVDGGLPVTMSAADAVVEAAATRRAAAESAATPPGRVLEATDDESPSLGTVGVAVTEAGSSLAAEHGPLEPTELRVGVDSVAPLLDAHGEPATFEFLVLLAGYVRAADAVGHVHLPVDRTAYAGRLLAPLFDAVVEVRVADGRPQQRWHLDDGGLSSRWLSL